jgi:tetratricopeptide (TPR) repeat protein
MGRSAVLLLLFALIAFPVGIYAVPHEIAHWQMARALEARLSGDATTALRWADRAVRTGPASAQLLAYRSALRRESGDLEGSLRDAQRVISLLPQRTLGYEQRGLTLQQAGRWREAVGDWKKLLELADRRLDFDQSRDSTLQYAQALNAYAYARALANEDLEAALEDIQQAIGIAGKNVSFVDTRGYVHFRRGDLEAALADMEWAVAGAAALVNEQSRLMRRQLRATVDQRQLKRALADLDHLQAVLLHHRGLVHLALGRGQAAKADLRRAEQLGFDPASGVY